MGRKLRREWVSEEFARYLKDMQKQMEHDLDRDVSRAEITSFIAFMRPQLPQIPKKRPRRSAFPYF